MPDRRRSGETSASLLATYELRFAQIAAGLTAQTTMNVSLADLDLQIDLLSEREITRILLAKKLDVELPKAKDFHDLARDVSPNEILSELDSKLRHYATGTKPSPLFTIIVW